MNALEFSGKIEQGIIRLPKQYEAYDNTYARIIILVEQPPQLLEKKEKLRLIFKKMEQIRMFSNINDPVEWQKQIRNEWD